jgi:hypothetical protein
MSSRLEIIKVNRYDADWDPSTIFSGFTHRAVLAGTTDVITAIDQRSRISKRLRREVGEEGVDWMVQTHPRTNEVEVYLKSSGILLMWKLQNHEEFSKLFDRVEQHTDTPDEISESPEQNPG